MQPVKAGRFVVTLGRTMAQTRLLIYKQLLVTALLHFEVLET